MDLLGITPLECPVEPLYKGQVGGGPFVQWSLSTRDKLGMGPLFSGASLQGTSWGWVLCSVEPLYKGQVGDGALYKGQVGVGPLSLI